MSAGYEVVELGRAEIDRVAPLFKQLVGFHEEVVEGAWPVRDPDAAWAIRRRQYEAWLGRGARGCWSRSRPGSRGRRRSVTRS